MAKDLAQYIRTLRLDIQYDGTPFVGWQRQAKGMSVQENLEKALEKVTHEKVTLFAASRTDAGVHARKQVVSFSLRKSRAPLSAFTQGTFPYVDPAIKILKAYEMPISFHANRCTKKKTYRYFLTTPKRQSVFAREHSLALFGKINWQAMKEVVPVFIGEHDFSALRTGPAVTKSSVRTIYDIRWGVYQGTRYVEICGSGFLRNMVRNLIGVLIEVGKERQSLQSTQKLLESKTKLWPYNCVPAKALFLWKVFLH